MLSKFKKKYFIVVLILFFAHCNSDEEIKDSFTVSNLEYGSVERIEANSLIRKIDERFITPVDISLSKDFLIIIDASMNPAVHVLNRDDLNYQHSFGREGRGPGEFLSTWSITSIDLNKNNIGVYDNILSRFSSFDIEIESDSINIVNGQLINLDSSEGRPVNVTLLNNNTLVGTGSFQEKRVRYFNLDGSIKKSVGDLPLVESKNSNFSFFTVNRRFPDNILQHAYQSKIESRPDGHFFAIAARHANLIEIYNHPGEKVVEIRDIINAVPKIDIINVQGNSVLNQGVEDFHFGYIDLKVSDSKIYGLFSGRKNADGNAYLGNEIHIFNWEGELLKILELNEYLIAIEVDEVASMIYGIEHYPGLSVNIYDFTGIN